MKTIFKYLVLTSLNILLYLFLVMPANAQRGGGGGGHSGGGGGGHAGGGGGGHFSGGGRTGGGFSGGSRPSFSPSRGGNSTSRVGVVRPASNNIGGNIRSTRVNGSNGYFHGNGPGMYGHGGRTGHYRWGRHNGYFYNHGYFGSLYFPMLGLGFGYLPDYYEFYWGDDPYYFSDGFYYQYNNDEYTVVDPPVGASIKTLPSNAQSIIIDGKQYYELNGVYYLPVTKDDGTVVYQISGKDGELNTEANGVTSIVPKIGDIVVKLPKDCRKITLNNQVLFVSEDGIYYQETKDSNNKTVYKIVGLEDEANGN